MQYISIELLPACKAVINRIIYFHTIMVCAYQKYLSYNTEIVEIGIHVLDLSDLHTMIWKL